MEKLMEEPSQGEAGLYPRKENTEETREGGKKGERKLLLRLQHSFEKVSAKRWAVPEPR